MKTIALDFDGVIHRYSKGWHDGTAYDTPCLCAEDAIKQLLKSFSVAILSTRDPAQIQDWMRQHMPDIPTHIMQPHDKFWNATGVVGIAHHKIAASVYVDDRAVRHTAWISTLEQIARYV